MRAGKLIIGTEQVCVNLAKRGKVKLVLIADGVSDSTRKKIKVKCEFYGVECISVKLSTDEVGTLLGKTYAPAVVAVTDASFATEILKATSSVDN